MRNKQSSGFFGVGVAVLTLLVAGPGGAQSWGEEPTRSTTQPTRSTYSNTSGSSRSLTGNMRGYQQYTGPYVQFGVNVGRIDIDDLKLGRRNVNVDTEASGGFTMTGGYRLLPWLSGEANFSYMGGGDVEIRNFNVGEPEAWAFNFGPKLYPMGFLDRQPIPEFFQPYALIGIGGGEAEIDGKRGFRDIERKSFTARFVTGFDLWFTDNIGAFMEGGYQVWDDDAIIGVGIWSFGAQYRF